MRIAFVTAYDPENYGVRCLIGQLHKHGHETHLVQLKNHMQQVTTVLPKKEPMMLNYTNGSLIITDTENNPITRVEQALYAETLSRLRPDVIGVSIRGVHENLFPLLSSVARTACPQAMLVAGGVGPTLNPEFYLQHGADAVIRGEGELPLTDLLAALQSNQPWHNVSSLVYQQDGSVRYNALLPLQKNLSQFPVPWQGKDNIHSIEKETYAATPMGDVCTERNPIVPPDTFHCISSRGCLGSCSYCSAPSLHALYTKELGKCPKMRVRSMSHLFEELHDMKKRGAKFIYIHDDFFVRPREIMHDFLDRYAKEIKIPFHAYFHPAQLLHDLSLIPQIVAAGCSTLSFGIQHGCESFCTKVYKRKFFSRQYRTLFESIMSHGANISVHFIGGNPLEMPEDFQENLDFVAQIPFDASQKTNVALSVFYLMYLPGAQLETLFPSIQAMPRSMQDFVCTCLLLDIRRMTTAQHFAQVTGDQTLMRSTELLRKLRGNLYRDACNSYLFAQVERLRGKKVYFWGSGEVYTLRKHLFSQSLPLAILVDAQYFEEPFVDGIPVLRPEDVLPHGEICPIIIFSYQGSVIHSKILQHYPQYTDIVLCKSN